MGRVKSSVIKTLGNDIIRENPDKFSENFDKNKEDLKRIKKISSKKTRNVLAGHITSQIKKLKKSGI